MPCDGCRLRHLHGQSSLATVSGVAILLHYINIIQIILVPKVLFREGLRRFSCWLVFLAADPSQSGVSPDFPCAAARFSELLQKLIGLDFVFLPLSRLTDDFLLLCMPMRLQWQYYTRTSCCLKFACCVMLFSQDK